MADLDKTMKEKELYDKAKKEMESIEKEYRNSPKLTKYFELLEQGKYTSAKIKYALLNQEEKDIAERYEQHFNYTAREVNSQEYLKTSIKKLENDIAYTLSYPENAIFQIQSADKETQRTLGLFNDFKNTINTIPVATNSLILIGPEGDFTPNEIALAKNKAFLPVSLGNTRLRTETAGVVAIALLANRT